MKNLIIAIDGPAGSGKSTIAKIIAKKFNFTYIDTGAMYRMITLFFLKEKIDTADIDIKEVLENISIDMKNEKFFLNDVDVTKEIREKYISDNVSKIASIKEVRENLVELQRKIASNKNVILDGRDIGTVVFPNAQLKIFLVASPEERANRRYKEFLNIGEKVSYDEVLESIKTRDKIDSTRKESPLVKASDALELDTTNLNIEDVVEIISKEIERVRIENRG